VQIFYFVIARRIPVKESERLFVLFIAGVACALSELGLFFLTRPPTSVTLDLE